MPERLAAGIAVQAGKRGRRQRPLPLSEGRACQRRQRGLRPLRRVPAARRQQHVGLYLRPEGGAFRSGRVADLRPVLGAGGVAPGRDRLVGEPVARSRRPGHPRPQHHRRVAFHDGDRHHALQSAASAVRQPGDPARAARRDRPGRGDLDDRRRRPDNWHDGIGLFGAGTPFATDVGIEVLRGPRDYATVKQALGAAGYNGEKIVVIAPTDVHGSAT